ncbi:hypothetical protein BH20CHL3_BH20CHL3_10030 [soil metagenome]
MRFMLTVRFEVEAGNTLVSAGRVGPMMQSVMGHLKPEAAYFGPIEGGRGAFLVVNIDDVAQIPSISEPFFQNLGATVTFTPVMTAEDLAKGIAMIPAADAS